MPYARFAFESDKTNIVFYESGKLVVQGKGTQEFVEFVLEPEILKEAKLGYETVLNPDLLLPRIGVDESGKGDFFGPLCIAGVYVNESVIKAWKDSGMRDSKNISSDKKISELAEKIRKTPGCVTDSVVPIGNEAYNRLYAKMRSVNTMLAWGHARVIENLHGPAAPDESAAGEGHQRPVCREQERDRKGADGAGQGIELVQRHKAEEDIAVAAASILARDEFVKGLAKLEKQFANEIAERRERGGGRGGERICGRTRRGRIGENFQAAFPHGVARARFARAAEDGVAETVKPTAASTQNLKHKID